MEDNNWISVEDRLPENHTSVIVFCAEWGYERIFSAFYTGVFHTGEADVTHWQPLPSPPENNQ